MTKNLYLNILRWGVYLSLICVFFVFKNFLFPFITSKQLPFNILMEVLFVVWLAFIVKYPTYRPKWSYVTFGLGTFFAIMLLSCFTGVDFNLSMWGDVERMLGAFHIAHFFILYLIVITVFREWKDWRILFLSSVIVAVFVAIKGIDGKMSYSTIGNSAYVSGYLIFNIYFALILFFKDKKNDYKWLYLLPIIFYYFSFMKANTTGAIVGLGFSLMVLFFLYGILNKNKKVKISTFGILIILVSSVTLILANKDSEFVKNQPYLKPLRQIDLQKNTFQTRLISWKAGIKDLKDHPLLGTGHGNFAVIFDKHFDPAFYGYTRSETYFDRAHNNLIDIASTTGVLGFLSYMSIFGAIGYYLVRGYRKDKIGLHEFVITSSLLIAYFVQNLAVFDSFVTYQMLMITLGYIYWLSNREEQEEDVSEPDEIFNNKEINTLVIAGLVMLVVIYQYNIKPWKMLIGTIDGQRVAGNTEQLIKAYEKALSYDSVLDRDSRTSLIRMFSGGGRLGGLSKERKFEILDYTIDLAEKNVAYNTHDSLNQMMLAQILNTASAQASGDQEKFMYYSNRALEAIDKAIEASPGRVPIYYQKAQIQMTRGENEASLDTLRYAYNLSPAYWDSACHLGKTLIYQKQEEEGYKYLDECVASNGGYRLLSPAGYVKSLVNRYVKSEEWESVTKLYIRLTELEPKSTKNWINLAKLYADQGKNQKAAEAVGRAVKLDPSLKKYADGFLEELK